jgi:glycosyltransferase involved in cell wall biosynthesis
MPLAIEQFDLSAYNLVISSSHAVAKGVITGPDQLHISYVHSPIRYAWDLQHQYLRESGFDRGMKGWFARWALHRIRQWDVRTANGVDAFVANSKFIAKRIRKVYRRDAAVIYPPVDVEFFRLCERKDDFYLTASRMVPYKRVPMIVEAFASMPDRRLVVIGDGPAMDHVKRAGAGCRNIEILGYQHEDVLRDYMEKARAFVFAAEEDFGIVPVEAQACGTPVIAYGRGGVTETVRGPDAGGPPTGVLFHRQTTAAVVEAVERFEKEIERVSPAACRSNAMRFSAARFRSEFQRFVEARLGEFRDGDM